MLVLLFAPAELLWWPLYRRPAALRRPMARLHRRPALSRWSEMLSRLRAWLQQLELAILCTGCPESQAVRDLIDGFNWTKQAHQRDRVKKPALLQLWWTWLRTFMWRHAMKLE